MASLSTAFSIGKGVVQVILFLNDWRENTARFPGELERLRSELIVLSEAFEQRKDLVNQKKLVDLVETTMVGVHRRLQRMRDRRGLIWTLLKGWKLAELSQIRADVDRLCSNMVWISNIPTDPVAVKTEKILASVKDIKGACEFWRSNIADLNVPTDVLVELALVEANTKFSKDNAVAAALADEIDLDHNGTVSVAEYVRFCRSNEISVVDWVASWKQPQSQRQRILWVDDKPENNTIYTTACNLCFDLAKSTEDAMIMLRASGPDAYAAVITDLARDERRKGDKEKSHYQHAGVDLIREIRKMPSEIAIVVFVSPESLKNSRLYDLCITEGATEVVADINAFLNKSAFTLDPEGYKQFNYPRPPSSFKHSHKASASAQTQPPVPPTLGSPVLPQKVPVTGSPVVSKQEPQKLSTGNSPPPFVQATWSPHGSPVVGRPRCRAPDCLKAHEKHFCCVCGNQNSTHRSQNCPTVGGACCHVPGCWLQHQMHECSTCGNPNADHGNWACPNPRPDLPRCKAAGCTEPHWAHVCKLCGSQNSDHRACNCPNGLDKFAAVTWDVAREAMRQGRSPLQLEYHDTEQIALAARKSPDALWVLRVRMKYDMSTGSLSSVSNSQKSWSFAPPPYVH